MKDSTLPLLDANWLGQSVASMFWICAVLLHGLTTTADWFQLFAAVFWLIAQVVQLYKL